MSSLFSDLPPATGDGQDADPAAEVLPPNKRLRLSVAEQPDAKPDQASFSDPVVVALVKITTHISSSKKFNRASELLRQLLVEDKIGQEHSKLVFEVQLLDQ